MTTKQSGRRRAGILGAMAAGLATAALLVLGAAVPATAGATAATAASWTPSAVALPASTATGSIGYSSITSTSCPSPGYCVAAGWYRTSAGDRTFLPLAEIYSGGSWSLDTLPLPSGAGTGTDQDAFLASVSCPTAGSCVAVGTYEDATGHDHGLIDTLSGGTWAAASAPEPATAGTGTDQYAFLASVSCPTAGSCVAVGTYEDATGHDHGLIDTLSGGTWTASTAPEPATAGTGTDQYAFLASVSCPTAGSCVAVGTYEDATGHDHGLIDTLSGGTWTASTAPEPATAGAGTDQYAFLVSVSCPTAGSCVAVGTYEDATGHYHGLIDTLSGGTWAAASAPEPATAGAGTDQYAFLVSVSCPTAGSCVAVGIYEDATGHHHGLIDTLSGGTWAAASAPEPATAGAGTDQTAYFDGVACTVAGSCVAVGIYEDATGHHHGLIDTLSGGTWTASTAPEPTTAGTGTDQDAYLESVSCVAGGCVAGGSFEDTAGGYQGLLETYDMTPSGYFEAASDGGIFAFTVPFHGSMGGKPLNAPIVAAVADPLTGGYYEVASDGGIFAFTAPFLGSMGGKSLDAPIVGMAFDTRTGGYYEVASDGGIFAFTAPFHGSMGGKPLNEPVVGMAFDPATGGYYEVASDGGLFSFTAPFKGSMGGKTLDQPIVGMTYDSLTGGYYEVASDGGLFSFTAPFQGSMGGQPLNEPVVGMAFDYGTGGYYEVASDGGLFAFNAPFLGSMGGKPLDKPIVTMALG